MTSLDTNVLVRLLVNDDPGQARRAADLLRAGPTWVAKTVLVEVEWVLRGAYALGRGEIGEALTRLLDLSTLQVEDPRSMRAALAWHAAGMDFADAVHLASSRGATGFATFDRALARKARKVLGGDEVAVRVV